jgi:predicted CoA-binding protein
MPGHTADTSQYMPNQILLSSSMAADAQGRICPQGFSIRYRQSTLFGSPSLDDRSCIRYLSECRDIAQYHPQNVETLRLRPFPRSLHPSPVFRHRPAYRIEARCLQMLGGGSVHLALDNGGPACYNAAGLPPRGISRGIERKGIVVATRLQERISDFVNRRVWAVVGASHDKRKFGYQVYRSLRDAGYVVFPVNPKGGELEGATVYPSLADLPEPPEVVDTVVPPHVTDQVVREMHELGLTRVWMQPGSESEAAISYCLTHGIQAVEGACAMVHRRRWTDS